MRSYGARRAPTCECHYFFWLAWLAVDDIQIPSVYELFHFLEQESSVVLEEVAVRTAFFRRESAAEHGPDGRTLQGMNRHTILRYSWRDRLRRMPGRR